MVEATGVELITMLITRKLLILGTATTAKKPPLPNPLYVYCTKMLSLWSRTDTRLWPQYPIDSSGWRKSILPVAPFQSTALPPDSQLAVGCDAGTHMARIGFLMKTSEL
jgi:hypothetical protein